MKSSLWVVVLCLFFAMGAECFGRSVVSVEDEPDKKAVRRELLKAEVKQCLSKLGDASFKVRRTASRRLIEIAGCGPLPAPPEKPAEKPAAKVAETDSSSPPERKATGSTDGETAEVEEVEEVEPDTDDDMEVTVIEVVPPVLLGRAMGGQVKRKRRKPLARIDGSIRSSFPYLEMVLEEASLYVHHSDPEIAMRAREVCEGCGGLIQELREQSVDERW